MILKTIKMQKNMFCGVLGMPFWSRSWQKHLYKIFKESNLQGTISSNFTTSYIVNFNFTLTNMTNRVLKRYSKPSKCQKKNFCGVLGMPFWSKSWQKHLYKFLRNQICKGPLAPISQRHTSWIAILF